MNVTVRGTCMAQHTDTAVIDPTQAVCGGYPHIGPVRFTDEVEWSDRWALLRARIPSDWNIVAVEQPTAADGLFWWVYVEPQGDTARRVNTRKATFEEASLALIGHFVQFPLT